MPAAVKLSICAIASEVVPFAKSGGLADVASALSRQLTAGGHDVRLFMPFYSQIRRDKLDAVRVETLQGLDLVTGRHEYSVDIWRARLPGSATPVYLVESDALYARPTLYTSDPDEHRRFLILTRAALECCRRMNFRPHIVHSHDWHTAFAPLWLRSTYKSDPVFAAAKSVLTIHNICYQGQFTAADVADLDLGPDVYLLHQDDLKAGHINALKHGILHADAVTTVSPTYARKFPRRSTAWAWRTRSRRAAAPYAAFSMASTTRNGIRATTSTCRSTSAWARARARRNSSAIFCCARA
jgi:starch synthase